MNTSSHSAIQPTAQDIELALCIRDYLVTGMHHFTIEGQAAIAKLIAIHTFSETHAAAQSAYNDGKNEAEQELRILRGGREDCLAALGYHPDDIVDIPAEIRRLRDENRAFFHRTEIPVDLEAVNLEMARIAEEEKEGREILP